MGATRLERTAAPGGIYHGAPSGTSTCAFAAVVRRCFDVAEMVSRPGFEPGTPCLKGRCSNR